MACQGLLASHIILQDMKWVTPFHSHTSRHKLSVTSVTQKQSLINYPDCFRGTSGSLHPSPI